jgi:hypothetical protein
VTGVPSRRFVKCSVSVHCSETGNPQEGPGQGLPPPRPAASRESIERPDRRTGLTSFFPWFSPVRPGSLFGKLRGVVLSHAATGRNDVATAETTSLLIFHELCGYSHSKG